MAGVLGWYTAHRGVYFAIDFVFPVSFRRRRTCFQSHNKRVGINLCTQQNLLKEFGRVETGKSGVHDAATPKLVDELLFELTLKTNTEKKEHNEIRRRGGFHESKYV